MINITGTAQTVVASVVAPAGAVSLSVRLSLFNNAMAEQVAIDNVMVLAATAGSDSSSGLDAASTAAVIGGVLGGLLLVFAVALLIVLRKRRRRHNAANRNVVSDENPVARTKNPVRPSRF